MSFKQPETARTLKDCVRHFTPAWFAAVMGTGSISILFFISPYARDTKAMEVLAYIFFFLNLALFIIFNALTLARYIIFPDIWSIMIHHPTQSLYIGTYPMGGATLLNVAVGLVYEKSHFGGRKFLYALWGLWWLDVIISFGCAFEIVHIMKTRHEHALNRMTAVWLLPVVTLIVISSTGGVFAASLVKLSPTYALITLTVSLVIVSMGVGLAMMILTMYLLRLIVHGVPPSSGVLSVFMPLGPMGQGGYSILLLGEGFRQVLPLSYGHSHVLHQENVGDIIAVIALVAALVLWSLATMWMIYGVLAVIEVFMWQRTRFPFTQAFWGLIFPNGVYATLTIQLYRTLDSSFFRVWGAIYSLATLFLWTAVFVRTVTLLRNGAIFVSPCLEDFDMARGAEKRRVDVMTRANVTSLNGAGTSTSTSNNNSGFVSTMQYNGTLDGHLKSGADSVQRV